jgi:hypothetical protein
MLEKKFMWCEKNIVGKYFKILLATVFLTLVVLSVSFSSFAEENEIWNMVKPLQDKLAALEDSSIDNALSLYGDMDSHWSRREVGMISCIGIVVGYDGNFHPNDLVQVDQYIKMVVKSMGYAPSEETKYWAQNYIDIALEQKLISKDEFPDYKRPITREEATRIIVKATLLKEDFPYNDPYNSPDNLVRSKIKDYSDIKDINKQFVLQSYEIGLIRGSGGYFKPAGTLTRAEAATIVIRYLDDVSRVPFTPAPDEVYTHIDQDGTVFILWPPSKKEVIDAANAFKNVGQMSKGYVAIWRGISHEVLYFFYEDEEMYRQNSILNTQLVIEIETMDDINILENAYHIDIYDADGVKRLHRDSIYEMFKFWFEKDADKAMAEFDRYLVYATSNDQNGRYEEITYNSRYMFFHKTGGNNGFTLFIYSL